MKEPTRLVDEAASAFERELLRSWHGEQPTDRARRGALALAASGGAAVLTVSASAKAAAPIGSKLALAGMVGKWIGVGAVAGLATSAASLSYFDSAGARDPSSIVTTAPNPITTGLAAPASTSPPAAAEVSAVATAREEPGAVAAVTKTAQPATRSRSALGAQIALLDRARNALHSGNPTRALELVAEYQRDYSSGVLAQEAEVLRIDALERQGNRAEAKRSAQRFSMLHPTSAHTDRLRRLFGDAANP